MAALFFDAVTSFLVITYFVSAELFSVIALPSQPRFFSGKVFQRQIRFTVIAFFVAILVARLRFVSLQTAGEMA